MEVVAETLAGKIMDELPDWEVQLSPIATTPRPLLDFCLFCVASNLGELYESLQGARWKGKKRREMREEGLWYLVFPQRGFLSLRIIDSWVYIYEIQLLEPFRGAGAGSKILAALHSTVKSLGGELNLLGTALTVFSKNPRAMKFYYGLNYKITADSPKALEVAGGKILEPAYYLMERRIE